MNILTICLNVHCVAVGMEQMQLSVQGSFGCYHR